MGVLEFLVPFYPINSAWVFYSSDLKMDPLNLYAYILIPLYPYTFIPLYLCQKNKINKKDINKCYMWHMTLDTGHLTHDTWHVTRGGGWTFYQSFSSLAREWSNIHTPLCYPILDTRISVLWTLSRSDYPPWNLKRAGLESSGRIASS